MTINIKATNMELTDAIREFTLEKVESLSHYFDNIQAADVEIGVDPQNKAKPFFAEVNLSVPGKLIRVSKNSEDLYKAIEKVKDHMKVELEKIKGKMRDKDKSSLRNNKGYQE